MTRSSSAAITVGTIWYQAANFGVDPESGEYPFAGIEPIGVPKALAGTVIPFTYGNLDRLAALLEEHAGEVAAIMMEPARTELPPPGYLEGVKALAQAHDAILIFDEVSCGWRLAIGGMQQYVGVTPDMTVVAKAMSNGYPMGAVVGARRVMEPAARHVYLQFLLERQHRVGRIAHHHPRTQTPGRRDAFP